MKKKNSKRAGAKISTGRLGAIMDKRHKRNGTKRPSRAGK